MSIRTVQLPALKDNYNYLLVQEEKREAIAIDPSGEEPIQSWLLENGLRLLEIWNTHHHPDHTGGNLSLKSNSDLPVLGPFNEKIPGRSVPLQGGEVFRRWSTEVHVLSTPGHTLGHISYYLPEMEALFSGDVLFSAGCGRLFEGTYEQAFNTLNLICTLPPNTLIYCGHEYSKVNTEFALQYEPGNSALQKRYDEILKLRQKGEPTVPTTLAAEKSYNPFLRTQSLEVRKQLGLNHSSSHLSVFKKLRQMRDGFLRVSS